MKKILFAALALVAFGFTGCVEDDPYSGFVSITQTPTSPSPADNVTVTARTTGIASAPTLYYKAGSSAQQTVTMTGSNNSFTGTIPAQADGTKVTYWIVAGDIQSEQVEYTVTAVVIEVVINEVNGAPDEDADRYIELFNKGTTDVPLEGYTITYKGDLTWTGTAAHTIKAGEYLVLKGSKGTGDLLKGLSSSQAIAVILYDATGNEISKLDKQTPSDGGVSMERIPNGTGDFYYTTPEGTPGRTNSTDTSGGKVQ